MCEAFGESAGAFRERWHTTDYNCWSDLHAYLMFLSDRAEEEDEVNNGKGIEGSSAEAWTCLAENAMDLGWWTRAQQFG